MADDLAVRHANYPNDHRDAVGAVMGPTIGGELMECVSAVYDPARNSTRLGFAVFDPNPVKVGVTMPVAVLDESEQSNG